LIPRSLLLIDADPAALGYLSGLLQRDDRQIQQAPGSKEALDLLRAGPFDLVLCAHVLEHVSFPLPFVRDLVRWTGKTVSQRS